MSIYEQKLYSFELNKEMMAELAEEFDVEALATDFAKAVDGKSGDEAAAEAERFFTDFGTRWIKKSHKLGEEYPDRTYEVLRGAVDHTGVYNFPFMLQRFIEIAYLSIMEIFTLPILQNSYDRLAYKMVDCPMFKALVEKCGQGVANQLPCRHACLTACTTVARHFGVDVATEMQGTTPKDGHCQFSMTPV